VDLDVEAELELEPEPEFVKLSQYWQPVADKVRSNRGRYSRVIFFLVIGPPECRFLIKLKLYIKKKVKCQ
jgi:hypothetical protein